MPKKWIGAEQIVTLLRKGTTTRSGRTQRSDSRWQAIECGPTRQMFMTKDGASHIFFVARPLRPTIF